jgi:hypothetical protein
MLIVTKSLFCSVGEVWFNEKPKHIVGVDVLYYRQWTQPVAGAQVDEFHTMLIDLTKPQDQLWQKIGKNDRYKIRRAEDKDQVVYEYWEQPSADIIHQFADFYDRFAVQKGFVKMNRAQLINRANNGALDISHVKAKDGVSLVWHGHYRNQSRARLLYSASLKDNADTNYQSMLGRANRYHHWQDILRFKQANLAFYDFGGWYTGHTDQEKLGINHFKEKFGGDIVQYFNCTHSLTLKGKVYMWLRETYLQGRAKLVPLLSRSS